MTAAPPFVIEESPWLAEYKVTVPEGRSGPWRVERFQIDEKGASLYNLHAFTHGYGAKAVPVGTFTKLQRDGAFDPMMSDTPAEVEGHLRVIREIKKRGGQILLNGLGIGLVLQAALRCENVTHVDVVEIDQDVANLVWPHYAADPRAQLHLGNALTVKWPKGTRWQVAWHDIWPAITSDNLAEMGILNRKYRRAADWQGAWEQAECKRIKRSSW